jgi:signal transduction histidine kinase
MLDITARKHAEQASRKYALELSIKNEQLEEMLQRAQEAAAIKGQFLARMSHEFRTPLNGIIGLCQLVHDSAVDPVSPEHKDLLEDVLASSTHLLQLVNDLLDLEKVESGRLEFSPQEVDPRRALNEVKDVLRPLADGKKISVIVEVAPDLRSLFTDPVSLKQVLYNYLSNAIKFTPDGGCVRVRTIRQDGETFCLEVVDTGIGIKLEDISRLFADFLQLDAIRKSSSQGAGLGLAITKRIVEAQGGTVGVRSSPGAGSTFFAVLPIRQARPPLQSQQND